jgi:hypothetical protein
MNKTPTKSNKIVFIKNNMLDLIPIAEQMKEEEVEKEITIPKCPLQAYNLESLLDKYVEPRNRK